LGTHDDAEWRDEDADGEGDADPAEDDDAVLSGGEEQREEEDEPEHAHVQEEQDLGREQLRTYVKACMHGSVVRMIVLAGGRNITINTKGANDDDDDGPLPSWARRGGT